MCVIKVCHLALSKNITASFKLLYEFVGKCHNKSKFYSGLNSFWVIQNNEPVIDILNKLSIRKTGNYVSTYVVSMLYTNILHDKLIKTLDSVIAFVFRGSTQNKISINNYRVAY